MLASVLPALVASAFSLGVRACGDDHSHAHDTDASLIRRAFPSVPLPAPTRPLVWGDVNIIHTTDSHGWLLGHQKTSWPEPNYSGDFGDFASFVTHMKELALEKDVDLLLVDSGDLHDGTGLSDGFPPGGVDGHESNKFIAQLPYDLLAIGNHELYVYANTLDMHQNFAPKFPGRYLSSNVNITLNGTDGQPVSVPVGSRYAKFKTRKGRKVTSLGVLFDFTGNSANTTVQKVEDMVKESWFAEAIQEEPDFFLLAGHMPVSLKDHWPTVFNAVRAVHPTTPILILGGHTHIRDCQQYDNRSIALESGRYMETVGWLSADLDEKHHKKNISFTRRYLDPNRVTYEYHTGRRNNTFDTAHGQEITKGLNQLFDNFDLSFLYGTAPQDYTLNRNPYPSNGSLLSLFAEQATPVALAINNSRASVPKYIISNSGALRFDLYKGAFTKNDQLTSSPFVDAYSYIPNVTLSVAQDLFNELNKQGETRRALEAYDAALYERGEVGMRYKAWLEEMDARHGIALRDASNLTLGYVTKDNCPGVGDDIAHAPLPFFSTPAFIASLPPNVSASTPIDLVYVNFFQPQLLQVLNSVQSVRQYAATDTTVYTPLLTNEVLGLFAQAAWNS
ncbi:hypothetical protein EVG20_g4990 [Dentipellis fragilis]|uniref:Calcineurin-like phosphoesterase domain-containing protein n=1 Tax=Dentipellis fragilis TaxID=205917 RepID=A0A4Y9YUN2_9AGAM|nr:hypothetical protein EVG20_g4990 [Dentipellis fragilis]